MKPPARPYFFESIRSLPSWTLATTRSFSVEFELIAATVSESPVPAAKVTPMPEAPKPGPRKVRVSASVRADVSAVPATRLEVVAAWVTLTG